MDIKLNRRFVKFCLLVILLAVAGCELVRKTTYPPDFTYLTKSNVSSSMHQLAFSVDKIDQLLDGANTTPATELQNSIINELNNMEEIANGLGAGTTKTNHLFIDQHIDRFKSDVIQARRFIEAEPSNYYLAGKLVGSCVSCHILRPDQLISIKSD